MGVVGRAKFGSLVLEERERKWKRFLRFIVTVSSCAILVRWTMLGLVSPTIRGVVDTTSCASIVRTTMVS